MPPVEITIESQREGDEDQRHALRRQAFGGTDPYDPDAPVLDADRLVCAYEGDRMVGAVACLAHHLWWHGRAVACGGVAGVVVAPEVRGADVARRMLAETFSRMQRRGECLSSLYPTTATLYRSMGYEIAGWYARRRIPIGSIPTAPADALDWRPVPLGDGAVRAVHERMGVDHDGWVVPDDVWWAFQTHRQRAATSTNRFAYVGRRHGEDVAAAVYSYTSSDVKLYDIEAEFLVGVDGDAVAAALGFVARNGTAAGNVVTVLPAAVLARHLPHPQHTTVASDWPWMLRIVDAPAAVAGRGFPSAVSGTVHLDLSDERVAANRGAHVLQIEGGRAELVRGGDARIPLTTATLARLYAGDDVRAMYTDGTLPGASADDLDLLAAAFVAHPTATLFY